MSAPTQVNEVTELEPGEIDGAEATAVRSRARRVAAEGLVELLALPVLVVVMFLGYLWWRDTAHLDAIESSSLDWAAVRAQAGQHVRLTIVSAAIVVAVAVPLGIALTRRGLRRAAPVVVAVANAGQAAPSIGLIVLLFIWLPSWSGFWVSVLALTLYGVLPVLRNTITGLQGVDADLVEAARGIGMSAPSTLRRIELPLALPVIMSGVRTSLVLIVGTATLATFVGGGGLGETLNTGITLFRFSVMVSAALLVALLALVVEWVGRVLELVLRPRGI